MCLDKWYWFAASVAVAVAVAVIYVVVTPPVYTRSASILIRDDSKGAQNMMESMMVTSPYGSGTMGTRTNINNELITLRSMALMKEVARRLGLDMNYVIADGFRDKELYNLTPVTVLFDSLDENRSASFVIKLLPGNKASLSHFVVDGEELPADEMTVPLSDSVATPCGALRIFPTSHYSEGYYDKAINFSKEKLSSAAASCHARLGVLLNAESTSIVDLSIEDTNPRRAENILNTLITVYNDNWIKDKNQIAVSTSMFIDERIKVIEGELGNVDDNISDFKSRNLLPNVEAASSMYMARSNENSAKEQLLGNQLSLVKYMRAYLDNAAMKDQLIPSNSGIENANVESLISQYNALLLKRDKLLANSSDKNPLVIDLNYNMSMMRQAIIRSVDNLTITLNTELDNVRVSERKTNERISSNPQQAKYLLSVERHQKVKEALYLFLLQKREENELSQAFTAYNTKVISYATGSVFPTSPRKAKVLSVALFLGLLLPGVIITLLETLNTKVRGREDINNALTIPFIGEIPTKIRKKKSLLARKQESEEGHEIEVRESNRNYINEAFRVVRTNMDFMLGQRTSGAVVMFTSVNTGSGKTFTSMNLASSMAIKGNKVAILDLDMRKASLSKYVGSPQKGLADYFAGLVDNVDEIMIKGQLHPNLDMIPVGALRPNPAELLLSGRLGELIERLKKEYDHIFLDCPPIDLVADAAIISKFADLTIFVIRVGLMDRRVLPEIEALYQEHRYNNMAVILNGAQYIRSKYGYHRYGYNYGYGYGYGYHASNE